MGILQFFQKGYVDSFKGLSKEVWYLAGVLLVNRAGAMVLPFLALYFSKELEWTALKVAIGSFSFGLGSLAGSLIGGHLSDKIGPYKVMRNSLFIGGLLFINMLWFTNFYLLCLWIFLTTTVADSFRPAAFAAISDYSSEINVTRGISLIRIAINLGMAVGPAVAGLLISLYSYNWLFIIDGSTCILAGFLLIYLLSHTRFSRNPDELEEKPEKPVSWWKDFQFVVFLLMNVLTVTVFLQLLNASPYFFSSYLSMSEQEIGWFFMANGLLIVVFEMPIIFWLEKSNELFRPLIIGSIMIAVSFLIFAFNFSPLVLIILHLFFITFGEIINFPYISSIAIKRAGPKKKGSYLGTVSTMFSVSFILSPFIGIPLLEYFGQQWYWTIMAIIVFISSAGFLLSKRMMKL
jgi:MFS family permease